MFGSVQEKAEKICFLGDIQLFNYLEQSLIYLFYVNSKYILRVRGEINESGFEILLHHSATSTYDIFSIFFRS
jgi:hypothetical protein